MLRPQLSTLSQEYSINYINIDLDSDETFTLSQKEALDKQFGLGRILNYCITTTGGGCLNQLFYEERSKVSVNKNGYGCLIPDSSISNELLKLRFIDLKTLRRHPSFCK